MTSTASDRVTQLAGDGALLSCGYTFELSSINHYFAFVVVEADGFHLP
jgi:hypothetical protein